MNAEQVAHLVENIIQTWPTGPRGRIWTDALRNLNHDRARHTYLELREHDDRPTIARFLTAYHATAAHRYGWQPPEDTGPPISLTEYLHRHPDDTDLFASRTRHPSSKTNA